VLAGVLNSLSLAGKKKETAKVVVAGAGAAGIAIAKLLVEDGFRNVLVCDRNGILADSEGLEGYKREIAKLTNSAGKTGTLNDALKGADVFIGVSSPNIITATDIRAMSSKPIIFALSNPIPEIAPDEAEKGGAFIYGTARSDLPNQINNVLGFPGIFRGALLVRASAINEKMKLAAAHAIAALQKEKLNPETVVPEAFDKRVAPVVALAVAHAAMDSGVARVKRADAQLKDELKYLELL
jgi:malate dehydrogenase (oxaloacetate-decarboxylating)